jgi:hypothetical protein
MMRAVLNSVLVFLVGSAALADELAKISPARQEQGVLVHEVESTFQSGATQIRVLLPEPLDASRRYPVIYLLPVEAGTEQRYGDGLLEVKREKLHQQYPVIFVAPTFSQLPWYADHPTDPAIRQESHFLQAVVPLVEKSYPTRNEKTGRLLLGFSKSGWGAWTLLLRHPDLFDRAAAWDAPLDMRESGRFGSSSIFGTQKNFELYRVRDLLTLRAPSLGDEPRLILMGWSGFRDDTQRTHALLDELGISHLYHDGPRRKHDWHSGWVSEAVKFLMADEE